MAATNPVPIDLGDDKPHALKYGVRAAALIEQEFGGDNIYKILRGKDVSFHFVSVFMWAGLLWEQPALTLNATYVVLERALESRSDAKPADLLVEYGLLIMRGLLEAGIVRPAAKPAANGSGAAANPPTGETAAPGSPQT